VRRRIAIALGVAAIAVGVKVGLWEAHFSVVFAGGSLPIPGVVRPPIPPSMWIPQPQFARWLCALLGAGAGAVVGLIALAVDRWPEATYAN
jgi:hypothetical protein